MSEEIELHARCHCKHADYTVRVPTSSLPLGSAFCNCSICRYATGQLAASFVGVPINEKLDLDVSHLSRYASSNERRRYFCPHCGANVIDFADHDDKWRFCTGVLDRTEGLLERNVIYAPDAGDGGLSAWLPFIRSSGSGGFPPDFEEVASRDLHVPDPSERLKGSCHCGGVQFQILPPPEGKRYHSGIDTCTSCRLTTGFEITAWTSIPLVQVQLTDGTPLNVSAGSVKSYTSSPGVYRHFCGTCGAAAFVTKDNQSWVDIAVGLLRADEGARAERWLDWVELGFPAEATDQALIGNIKDAFEAWCANKKAPTHKSDV